MPPRNNRKERSSRQTKQPESQTQHIYSLSSPPPMKPLVFPPGFKFTDEDLIFHYLKPFLEGSKNPYPNVPIHRVNIYESNPEQLSKKYEKGNDKEWFFITERTKIREGSKMWNRCDNGGSWKSKTVPKKIEAGQGVVGYKTLLEYRIGRQQNAVRSDWIMHEYWFDSSDDKNKVDHALCKICLRPRVQKRKAEEEENERRKKKKKMKEEGVATVDQPCNAAFQQPQFSLPPLEPFQPQQSQQPHNVATVVDVKEEEVDQPCNSAIQRRQFCETPLYLCQPHQSLIRKQLHNVATVIDV